MVTIVTPTTTVEATSETGVGYFFCGEGHVFSWGDEDWHAGASQAAPALDGRPLPTHCPHTGPGGRYCLDSAHLVGPYDGVDAAIKDAEAWAARWAEDAARLEHGRISDLLFHGRRFMTRLEAAHARMVAAGGSPSPALEEIRERHERMGFDTPESDIKATNEAIRAQMIQWGVDAIEAEQTQS